MKSYIMCIGAVLLFIFIYTKGLMIGNERMFITHDTSQPARIVEFVHNISEGHVPPRIAPEMSFRMGWPLFSMYAPLAYWVAALLTFTTKLDVIDTLRLTYLATLSIGFLGTLIFLRRHFSPHASLLGAAIYSSSSYIATNIFIRGALAESWYIATLPIALWGISFVGDTQARRVRLLVGYFCVGIFMMSHNSLAPLSFPLLFAYAAIQKCSRNAYIVLIFGVLMSSHFLLPLIIQNRFTHAYEISTQLKPEVHFLCAWQLWDSNIGYGASVDGCDHDSMPFNIGKPQLLAFVASLFVCAAFILKEKNKRRYAAVALFAIWATFLIFMTLYASAFVWTLFSRQLSLIQFPWRFIGVSLIGISFICAQATDLISNMFGSKWRIFVGLCALSAALFITLYQSRYFVNDQHTMSVQEYERFYFSQGSIWDRMSYGYVELIPASVDTKIYEQYSPHAKPQQTPKFYAGPNTQPFELESGKIAILKNGSFQREAVISMAKDALIYANIHAHPSWRVVVDGKDQSSWDFYTKGLTDRLGRPRILLSDNLPHHIVLYYSQTFVEILSNILSLASTLFLVAYILRIRVCPKIHVAPLAN